jgi:hypothetical protein
MPKLDISLEGEQKAFDIEVVSIQNQWSSSRQSHLKRWVFFRFCSNRLANKLRLQTILSALDCRDTQLDSRSIVILVYPSGQIVEAAQ